MPVRRANGGARRACCTSCCGRPGPTSGSRCASAARCYVVTDGPRAWLTDGDSYQPTRLGEPEVSIVDGSFYLPALKRDAKAEFAAGHIPGAVFFDIDAIADDSTDLPHMLPGATKFSEAVGALGVGKDDTIVVYDGAGLGGAPRVWWTFRAFGAKNVYVLDGGLPKWQAEGHPVEAGPVQRTPRKFEAELNTGQVANVSDVQMALLDKTAQVVDARPAARFRGEAAEPRPGIRSGHMPGAANLPSSELLNRDLTMKDPATLRALFTAAGVEAERPVVTSCGTGVTACALALGLVRAGFPEPAVYDGSWTEWASRPETPKVTA